MKIAFHSYKGGVGRTKLMVGVAALMAKQGRRVGMLDFDLDSSGLVNIFSPEFCGVKEEELSGIEDEELVRILRDPSGASIASAWVDVGHKVEERFNCTLPQDSRIRYLPTVANPELSDSVDLSKLTVFLDDMINSVEDVWGVNWVLVDLKPGYSPSYKYVLPLMDMCVLVTRLDNQNISGLKQLWSLLKQEDKRPILVANMIPKVRKEKVDAYKEKLEETCGKKIDVCIYYDPDLLFDDDFECFAVDGSDIQKKAERLIEIITS